MRPMSTFAATILFVLTAASLSAQKPSSWQKFQVAYPDCTPVNLSIYYPSSFSTKAPRTLILLHSWGRSSAEWEKTSAVAKLAEESGVAVVCPDMGKTVYENEYFGETQNKWNALPGGVWIVKALVPWLQKEKNLCTDRMYTGIAGLEIGARGALLTAARMPEVFAFAGGISGLYDSGAYAKGEALAGVYGRYRDNKDRWENADSIINTAPSLSNTYVFLTHGKKEKNPGIEQTQFLLIRLSQLKKKQGGFNYKFSEKPWGDGWAIWAPSLAELVKEFETSARPAEKK